MVRSKRIDLASQHSASPFSKQCTLAFWHLQNLPSVACADLTLPPSATTSFSHSLSSRTELSLISAATVAENPCASPSSTLASLAMAISSAVG
eukprot:CAMPEP_0174902456 /NCGR_PEP_ID=MMETSP0167-20121228/37848_1 /TAXON_ID=38298 /ORGANISM="Rhodella maculata, Strain CCMP736" /LENGTH=92 /DNA_ID=CAMNT_0016144469 /DNA_START=384 /DNA_END=658 /DNA_ORIENTATION=+